MPTEKELDRALEAELRENEEFRHWFVSKSKFKGTSPRYVWSRSDNPWCRLKLSLPDPETGEPRSRTREGETDVLFVFAFPSEPSRRLALHIENKLASGRFTNHQPEVYSARAKCWLRNPEYGNYDDWDTLLLAPASFYERCAIEAKKFGCFVSHEEVAEFVPLFRSHTE
jgi:hypothetical protein